MDEPGAGVRFFRPNGLVVVMSKGELIERDERNAAISWSLVAILVAIAVVNAVDGDPLWAGFAFAIVVVAVVPAVVTRDRSAIVSWEALLVTAVAVAGHVFDAVAEPTTYVAVAALALLLAVEIVSFSSAEMPSWFAIAFVVMGTMTIAAVWGIVRFYADAYLGTSLLSGREDLMWDLVAATAVGVASGLVFELYFRERAADGRLLDVDGE